MSYLQQKIHNVDMLPDPESNVIRSSVGFDRRELASQARLFRAVAELTARESHEEEELLPELLQREKSLVAFENVIVTWDPRSGFIA